MKKAIKWIIVLLVLAGIGYGYRNRKSTKEENLAPVYNPVKVEKQLI